MCDTKKKIIFPLDEDEINKLAAVDIKTVDPGELEDIENIQINRELPEEERIKDFVQQVKNPYCYKDHGIVVKLSFSGTKSLEECLSEFISLEG